MRKLAFGIGFLASVFGFPVSAELRPLYPEGMSCGLITSFFGDLRDLDGSRRDVAHEGIDLGRIGDRIISPADGKVTAIWPVDHGWGRDWNLLMTHSADDLNFSDANLACYTEFDHLQERDLRHLRIGQRVRRGDPIGIVRHPGDAKIFRAEVHMETYFVPRSALQNLVWRTENGWRYWWNGAATLVNPLELFHPAGQKGKVLIPLYEGGADFVGMMYPLDCLGTRP